MTNDPETDPVLDETAGVLVGAGVAPAASVAVARRAGPGWELLLGAAGTLGRGNPSAARPGTLFDLASVTKPFFAATVARLVQAGALGLRTPLCELLPEVASTANAACPLELLLAHRAGLEAHRPLFAPLLAARPIERRRALQIAADARRAECTGSYPAEGFAPLYSDLGYLLAGEAVSRALGRRLGKLFREQVAEPLGLDVGPASGMLSRLPGFTRLVAETENVPWRGGVLRGVVHDENAWALWGHGMAGHAGLFGTAAEVARFGCAVLDSLAGRSSWLTPEALAPLVRERQGGSLRAGFDGLSGPSTAAGTRCGPHTFGHLGFTGTSIWCDPDNQIVTVLLTNRVNPTREHIGIRAARPLVQDRLMDRAMGA